MLKKIAHSSLFFFVLSNALVAQEVPQKNFRFLPLGELRIWGQNQLPGPPPGPIPPQAVTVLSGEAEIPLDLELGSFTERVSVKADTPTLTLKQGKVGAGVPWIKTKMPTSPLNLGILYRDHQAMNWNQPKILVLKDDASSFPADHIRLANVSDRMVLVQLGDPDAKPTPKIFGIPAGKAVQKALEPGKNQIRVGYLTDRRRKQWIWEHEVTLQANERLQTFFYKARGKALRQNVLFRFVPEPVP